MLKSALGGESVKLDQLKWYPLPEGFVSGHVMWKRLHVSPNAGSWTVMFQAPKDSSFAGHIHSGPGEYFLTKGKVEVRGGEEEGGVSATGPRPGYEACNARHDKTLILEDSEIYMTFQGPLQLLDDKGRTQGVLGWEQAHAMWAEQAGQD